MELKEIFKDCSFEKTDGYRYVLADVGDNAVTNFMKKLDIEPSVLGDGRHQFQISSLNPRMNAMVSFIDEKLAL